jgi:hypothetical protein
MLVVESVLTREVLVDWAVSHCCLHCGVTDEPPFQRRIVRNGWYSCFKWNQNTIADFLGGIYGIKICRSFRKVATTTNCKLYLRPGSLILPGRPFLFDREFEPQIRFMQ